MFDKLRTALQRAGTPELISAPVPQTPSTALVPIPNIRGSRERPEQTMGYLDRNVDSARPPLHFAPALRTADAEIRQAWMPVAGHARHLLTTSGFLQYGVELACAWTCGGDGLQPNVTPDVDMLGWQPSFAATWARTVERRFREWSHDPMSCDAQGRMKFGAIQNAALKGFFATGDVLATLDYGVKSNAAWKTSISLIDPSRLWTPPVWRDRIAVVHDGIEFDGRNRAQAYHIRLPTNSGVTSGWYGQSVRVPAWGNNGRRLVCHAFDGEAGTIRGISPLGAAIGAILQTQNLADAAILAAHIAAMVVGVVTSDLPPDLVSKKIGIGDTDIDPLKQSMAGRMEWHELLKKNGAHLQLGHSAKVIHMATCEDFKLMAGKDKFDAYEPILKMGLAEAARALGLSPEHLTGDKSDISYSSGRLAIGEAFSIINRRRKIIVEPLVEFALEAVVEEMVANGELPFPAPRGVRMNALDAFRKYKRHALKAEFIGPAAISADELKSARAAVMRMQYGMTSLSDEIAALGGDAEATIKQRQADEKMLNEHQITLPWPTKAPPVPTGE
jgi:lambda family phage portal protein